MVILSMLVMLLIVKMMTVQYADAFCDVLDAEAGQQQPLLRQLAEVASRPLVQRQVQGGQASQRFVSCTLFGGIIEI